MLDWKEKIAQLLAKILDLLGIDYFLGATIIMLLLTISYRKHFNNWKNVEGWLKAIILVTTIGAVFFSIISILRVIGIIKF